MVCGARARVSALAESATVFCHMLGLRAEVSMSAKTTILLRTIAVMAKNAPIKVSVLVASVGMEGAVVMNQVLHRQSLNLVNAIQIKMQTPIAVMVCIVGKLQSASAEFATVSCQVLGSRAEVKKLPAKTTPLLGTIAVMANTVTKPKSALVTLVKIKSARIWEQVPIRRLASMINFHLSIAAMVCTAAVPMSAKATLATAGLPASA